MPLSYTRLGLLALLGGLMPAFAQACDLQSQSTLSVALTGTLQSDPLQASVGDALYTRRASLSTLAHRRQDIVCAPVSQQEQLLVNGNMLGSMTGDHLYPTSVPGIGVRLSVVVGRKGNHSSLMAFPGSQRLALNRDLELSSDNVYLKTELVKTGPISSLGNVIRYLGPSSLSFSRSAVQQAVNVDFALAITPPAGYCRFTSKNAAFSLPAVEADRIKPSSILPATPMPIGFSCTGSQTHIEMTIYGVADNKASGVLSNKSGEGQATGVGVQLLYRNQPVTLGVPVSLDELPQTDNRADIPLSARYIASSNEVTPGKVETAATLVLNFL